MRVVLTGLIALSLAACGGARERSDDARADADARAAGFTPPAVTSRLDWGSQQERRFNELDRNADGKLTDVEFPRANSRIARADANGDGEITKGEYNEGAIARFDRMDLNKDGTVTSEEQETTQNGTVGAE